MADAGMTRLDRVKQLLGITGSDQDGVLTFAVETVERMVLQYLHQDALPEALENVLVLICVSYCKTAALGSTDPAMGAVTAVKRGDVSTSFAAPDGASGSAATFNLGESGDFFGWRTVLTPYRKLRW